MKIINSEVLSTSRDKCLEDWLDFASVQLAFSKTTSN